MVQNSTDLKYSSTGGTAGSVIATRLAAISNVSILVIEAGGRYARSFNGNNAFLSSFFSSNEGVLNTIVPFLASTVVGSSVDWNFSTVPQANLNNRVVPYPRGFVLGGSSSISKSTDFVCYVSFEYLLKIR